MNSKKSIGINGILSLEKKSSVFNKLREKSLDFEMYEAHILKDYLRIYPDDLPISLPDNSIFIILEDNINEILPTEINGNETIDSNYSQLFLQRNRFKRLAIKYQLFYIEIYNRSVDEVVTLIASIANNPSIFTNDYIIPNPDNFNKQDFDKLDFMTEGESKVIRVLNKKYTLISYKPTIHSHKQQRAGIIEGSDIERKKMTKDILYLLDIETIPHTYVYVGKEFTLCERLDLDKDIPPVEVVVKRCCVGTDKYRYFEIDKRKSRFGGDFVSKDENREYPDILVRFDYRNPNHHPETKKPLGDEAMYEDLADYFIDVKESKKLVRRTFNALSNHFEKMGVYFVDVCFMVTTDGKKHYYEISQDCGRYKKKDENGMSDLDKDIWRAGGSSDLVLIKWREMTKLTHDYVRKIYSNY